MRRLVFPALLILPLALAACREPKVTSYRVPKEKEPAHSAGDGHAHAAPAPGAAATSGETAPAAPAASGAAGGGMMASTPVATASGGNLTWTAPASWQSKQGSAMRKATFVIAGEGGATAELAVTAFPGDVGGEVANVNRWRGQMQLPPLSDADAAAAIARLEASGLKVGYVDLTNTVGGTATRMLGAFVPHAGATWFFKLTGPDALVAKEKPAFVEFLKSIKPAAP